MYVVPYAWLGKVPKNKYNRIDLFHPSMLPPGGAFIQDKGAAKLCKLYNIDFTEAVVEFDFRKRPCVPIIGGIVVPAESEQLILDA
ncbi:hypothetical protein EV182_008351, partial [Spiromyces aspiralis]